MSGATVESPLGEAARAVADSLWGWVVVRGVLTAVVGVVAVVWPGLAIGGLVILFGVSALVDGLATLFEVFRGRSMLPTALAVTLGALTMALGVIVLLLPEKTVKFFIIVLAIGAITGGIFRTVSAFELRRNGGQSWVWVLVGGLMTIAFGVVAFASWNATAHFLAVLLGIWLILFGLIAIGLGVELRKFGKAGPRIIEG